LVSNLTNMTIQVRSLGYTNSLQQLVWNGTNNTRVTAYLWGAGGGGGGNDSGIGGQGGGGGFTQYTFTVNDGDVIRVAVGGKGYAGSSNSSAAAGGQGGRSYFVPGSPGYYGGVGGSAGPSGRSGGGGGGGGATVLLLNGSVVSVAAGGGGGGGAGNVGTRNGDSAPGTGGQSGTTPTGGDGTIKGGDGGGGGAGGGGLRGGFGGNVRSGDQGAEAGAFGLTSAPASNPSGRDPGGRDNGYYIGSAGVGGATASDGTAGYAVFEFSLAGVFVHNEGSFVGAQPFVKFNNEWNQTQAIWIKTAGVWEPVIGYTAPEFTKIPNNFGGPGRICISVIDECSRSASTIQGDWNSFVSSYPGTPMYLLQPGGPDRGNLKVPTNFTSSGQGFGPIAVNRDGGIAARRSDWFELCGLSAYPPGSWVQVSIDNSGSMTFGTVEASYNYLVEQCQAAGFTVSTARMSGENWVAPFI
jgi:hypothetical protein